MVKDVKRRSPVIRWLMPLAVILLLALATGVTLVAWPGPAPVTDTPTLPKNFAGISYFTSSASSRPAGRAIALYGTGTGDSDFRPVGTLVAGADRDTYRYTSKQRDTYLGTAMLSPDGTHVLSVRRN